MATFKKSAKKSTAKKTSTASSADGLSKTLSESALRSRYGVTVVGVKRRHYDFTYAKADTIVEAGDILIVSGSTTARCGPPEPLTNSS